MFNQKVNGFWSQNPDYLNYSLGAPAISAEDIHNCGTTVLKYNKEPGCNSLPLQNWCSPNVAVESFGMRPIVNSKEYFENIKKYFSYLIYNDSVPLKKTGMSTENYNIVSDYGLEPQSSFLQAINLEATNKMTYLMGESAGVIDIFKNYNPLCEGLVITDIDIDTFQSVSNPNHFVHKLLFSVFNTTRYNTISIKAQLYQDTSTMMDNWNKSISLVENSKDLDKSLTNANSTVYVAMIDLLNNTNCVLGQESDCEFKGHNISGKFSQLLNDNLLADTKPISWIQPNVFGQNAYTQDGYYDSSGNIVLTDKNTPNVNDILANLK